MAAPAGHEIVIHTKLVPGQYVRIPRVEPPGGTSRALAVPGQFVMNFHVNSV